ncbi:MAG: phage tail sheath subtilisin-like domain-containing protein, partial [Candidatus Methylumidiphilus sp.]
TEGRTSPAIAGAPTSVAGFILRSRRGPTEGEPVFVTSFSQFVDRFGGYHKDLLGAYCIEGFFLNGGQQAYIARVSGAGSTAASVTLKDRRKSENSLKITAGYRGREDIGSWGNDLYIDIQDQPVFSTRLLATLDGNTPYKLLGKKMLKTPVDLSSFTGNLPRTLSLQVDEDTNTYVIDFGKLPAPGTATAQDIANAVNSQCGNKVLAKVDGSALLLISCTKGVSSNITIQPQVYEETRSHLGFDFSVTKDIGSTTESASIKGDPITEPLDLRNRTLILSVDQKDPIEINFNDLPNAANAELADIVQLINKLSQNLYVAKADGIDDKSLVLTSTTNGDNSAIDIGQTGAITLNRLGFNKLVVIGSDKKTNVDATSAELVGKDKESFDLPVLKDSPSRTITFLINNDKQRFTVFLPNKAGVTIAEIVKAITEQGKDLVNAEIMGNAIKVSTVKKGADSRIELVVDDTIEQLGLILPQITTGSSIVSNLPYKEVQVQSILGLKGGDWVRIADGISENYLKIADTLERRDSQNKLTYIVNFEPPNLNDKNQYRVEDGATLSTCEFSLGIRYRGTSESKPVLVESWGQLSLDPKHPNYVDKLNHPSTGSKYVVLTDFKRNAPTGAPAFTGLDVPWPQEGIRLGEKTPSTSDLDRVLGTDIELGTSDYESTRFRFDTVAVQLVAVLENLQEGALRAVSLVAMDYCENTKGDCMFVGHTPPNLDVESAKAFGQDLQSSKRYGALYWPWITVTDPIGRGSNPTRVIPPTGHVLGVYARIDQTRGIWKAPAGNEAVLRGALAVETDITDANHTNLVKNGSVNGIRRIRGAGIVIDASRTLSTDTRWLYVNVRLLFNYVKASLREELRWVKQEPNREALWNTIKYSTVTPFLQRLYHSGAFGPGSAKDVFTVVCGPENNPPDRIQVGEIKVEVYFYPARPAETIIIVIGQQDGGTTAREP